MSKVKVEEIEIKPESKTSSKIKISELEVPHQPTVKEFDFHPLKLSGKGDYSNVKAEYGPLASTDVERTTRTQKDRRFSLNPLLREPLSVEQEEKRVIEQKVRTQVRAVEDEAKAEAAALGYKEGWKTGHDEAYKKFEAEGAASLKNFDNFVQEAENAKQEIFRANERLLIELIFRIAKLVILKELSVDKEYLLRLARELIGKVGARDNITIKIHPEEAKTIDMLKDGLMKVYGQMNSLNIETSSQIKRGGCQIETEWSAMDGSVEKQLEGIYNSLVGKRSDGGGV